MNRFFRSMWVWALFVTLAAVLLPGGASARSTASALRLGDHPGGVTRLVLDLTEPVDFNTALYADPYRVVVNTVPVTWDAGEVRRGRGSVKGLRYDEDSLGGRIMIDLQEPALVKSAFLIPPRDGQKWRFVMDLQSTTRSAFLTKAIPSKMAHAEPPKVEAAKVDPVRADVKSTAKAPVLAEAPAPRPAQELAASEQPRNIVVMSPQATNAPQPAPAAPPVSQPTYGAQSSYQQPVRQQVAEAQPVATQQPAASAPATTSASSRTSSSGSPIMSLPVPPPLERTTAKPAVATQADAPVVTKASMTLPAPDAVEPRALPADGKPVVVIDPGHGGADPGAIGVSGIYEKYITLAVARELKSQLEKNGRYKVYLTRDRDVFIRLRDRVAIARQYNADLFISLHADSVGNSQMKGLSVYTLSQNASDSEAQALADKENKADLIAGVDLSHESADVANILIDLAQRETMNRSAGFAGNVVTEVGREIDLLGNTHRFAGFAVLKGPDVPAVLVEMGYLSNDGEERNLRQPEYRTKLATGISRAVDRFFVQGQKARRP